VKRALTACACAVLGFTSLALAQSYAGVAPGSTVVPEGIAAPPGGPAMVTWPGFQMTPDGGSRLFVQTTIEVKPELKRDGGEIIVVLPHVSLPPGNARLPLDTHFFNTPLKTARLKAREGGVAVHLEMKPGISVSPGLRTEKAPTGYYFVYVEFPPGNYR
jgi:hypothetical protein